MDVFLFFSFSLYIPPTPGYPSYAVCNLLPRFVSVLELSLVG